MRTSALALLTLGLVVGAAQAQEHRVTMHQITAEGIGAGAVASTRPRGAFGGDWSAVTSGHDHRSRTLNSPLPPSGACVTVNCTFLPSIPMLTTVQMLLSHPAEPQSIW